jgi:shikimate kinase / 3-dehydroquinate synthase
VIVLVGFMGAGKSSVGRILAGDLGIPFTDTDDVVEQQAGMSVREVFDAWGESGFRQFERAVVSESLAGPDGVISLGGGALTDEGTRRALEEQEVTIVHLDVSFEEAMRRVGDDAERPMLAAGDPRLLYESRRALYEDSAAITVSTDDRWPDAIARAIEARIQASASPEAAPPLRGVTVSAAGGSYEVVVGADLLTRFSELVPELEKAEKAFVISHPELRHITQSLIAGFDMPVEEIDIPAGESSKSLDTAHYVFGRLAEAAAHRSDLVIGVGGGVVTDMAGFVASAFNRGMRVVHVPTSLLGQVDAAVGGKTGVNLPEGKNLVGTFHQPAAVICDIRTLDTLPNPELRSGMAEVVKYGLISDPDLLELVTRRAADVIARDERLLIEIVARSVAIKAAIVSEDEREEGRRAVLNYGHTFAHAIEQTSGYESFRHGEAVSVGMMAAAWLGRLLDRIDEGAVDAHRDALEASGLPTTAPLELDRLEQAWKRDKKYDRDVRFVLLSRIGHAEFGIAAPREAIAGAIARVTA